MSQSEHPDVTSPFRAHGRALALYARQWLVEDLAADAVQEAFLKLLSQRDRPRDVRAWLFRTVRNAAINELRRQRTAARLAPAAGNGRAAWFEEDPAAAMDAKALQHALAELPAEQAELVVMRIWGEMTFEQMAEVAGESVSTVYGRYGAAIESLRKRMVTP